MSNKVNRAPVAKNDSKYIVNQNGEPNGCRDTFIGYVIGIVIAFILCVCFVGCKIPQPIVTETVEVEVVPPYYQNTSKGFWVLLAILVLIIGWKLAKAYFKIQTGGLGSILSKFL